MKIRHNNHSHEVYLSDDGTMDTVIEVDGQEIRYSGEYAASYRTRDGAMTAKGLRELAIEACDDDVLEDK